MARRDRLDAVALLLAAIWLGAMAWSRPLALPDEGRYVGVAWEMLRSGQWLTPTLNGLPYFHKPPLFYWITAASMSVFGINEWAARAAPMLGAFAGVASMYLFVRRWGDRPTAALVLVALLAQPLFFLSGQFANLDMLVAGLITPTVLLLADAALRHEKGMPNRASLRGAHVFAALAVLAKGLIGVVIPALVLVAMLVVWRRFRLLPGLLSVSGSIFFALITLPWFWAMHSRYPAFLDYFFVEQHFRRFASGGFNNVEPFWFFPALLMVLCIPWLPWAGRAWLRRTVAPMDGAAVRTLMAVWVVVVVVFFSFPASKLIGYVLPAVPPLAYLAVDAYRNFGTPSPRQRLGWWVGIGALALTGMGILFSLSIHPRHSTKTLAELLAASRAKGEPVLMLEHFPYDVPLYARLTESVVIVDHWEDESLTHQDTWRKELADAGKFAPDLAARTLIPSDRLADQLCRTPVTWIISSDNALARYPVLSAALMVSAGDGTALWRFDRDASRSDLLLGCPEMHHGALRSP